MVVDPEEVAEIGL